MKYLLVLFVVLVGFWIWRSNRQSDRQSERQSKRQTDRAADGAIDMVGCDLCGLHCPRTDLIAGRNGVYCSVQHRDQAEA